MPSEAQAAVQNALNFECKKDGMRQAQSGLWTLTLRVHPEDMPYGLLTAPMGTRYVIAAVEVSDDETPVEQSEPAKTKVSDIYNTSLAQEAGRMCGEGRFIGFLKIQFPDLYDKTITRWPDLPLLEGAARMVRSLCKVASRSEFDTDPEAAKRWIELRGQFNDWLVT